MRVPAGALVLKRSQPVMFCPMSSTVSPAGVWITAAGLNLFDDTHRQRRAALRGARSQCRIGRTLFRQQIDSSPTEDQPGDFAPGVVRFTVVDIAVEHRPGGGFPAAIAADDDACFRPRRSLPARTAGRSGHRTNESLCPSKPKRPLYQPLPSIAPAAFFPCFSRLCDVVRLVLDPAVISIVPGGHPLVAHALAVDFQLVETKP